MRSDSTLSVIFFTRNNRKDLTKLAIYARITVNGKRTEISLKRYIPVYDWDASKGRARGHSGLARQLNTYLDEVYGQILDAHRIVTGTYLHYLSSGQGTFSWRGRPAQDLKGTH